MIRIRLTEVPAPTVNINGTSKDQLMRDHQMARDALRDAVEALKSAAPHGRDYPGSFDLRNAQSGWRVRMSYLEGFIADMDDLIVAINGQVS